MPSVLVSRLNWDLIYPPLAEKSLQLVQNCRALGLDYYATSGFRTPEEQLVIWQKGRDTKGAVVDPKKVVTKVRLGLHNFGIAVDWTWDEDLLKDGLQPNWRDTPKYETLGKEARKLGLESGYFWKVFPDPGHVQIPIGSRNILIAHLKKVYAVRGAMADVWAHLDKHGPW